MSPVVVLAKLLEVDLLAIVESVSRLVILHLEGVCLRVVVLVVYPWQVVPSCDRPGRAILHILILLGVVKPPVLSEPSDLVLVPIVVLVVIVEVRQL